MSFPFRGGCGGFPQDPGRSKGTVQSPGESGSAFEEKEKVISRIFPEEMKNFLCVVCKYAHAALLPEIFQAYQDYYNEQHKILTADLYCVVPPSQKQLEGIRKFLLKRFQTQDAKIRIIKDESLVGGFLIRTRDQELDYSLKGRINALQQKLIWR